MTQSCQTNHAGSREAASGRARRQPASTRALEAPPTLPEVMRLYRQSTDLTRELMGVVKTLVQQVNDLKARVADCEARLAGGEV